MNDPTIHNLIEIRLTHARQLAQLRIDANPHFLHPDGQRVLTNYIALVCNISIKEAKDIVASTTPQQNPE